MHEVEILLTIRLGWERILHDRHGSCSGGTLGIVEL